MLEPSKLRVFVDLLMDGGTWQDEVVQEAAQQAIYELGYLRGRCARLLAVLEAAPSPDLGGEPGFVVLYRYRRWHEGQRQAALRDTETQG